jgi:hypothetical protein
MPRYSIVGMNFRNSERFVMELRNGAEARLVREPDNVYDKNAVAVWIGGTHVGYVPKTQNQELAAFIDEFGEPMIKVGALAEDGSMKTEGGVWARAITARFVRSPNSGYPQVET